MDKDIATHTDTYGDDTVQLRLIRREDGDVMVVIDDGIKEIRESVHIGRKLWTALLIEAKIEDHLHNARR